MINRRFYELPIDQFYYQTSMEHYANYYGIYVASHHGIRATYFTDYHKIFDEFGGAYDLKVFKMIRAKNQLYEVSI